VSPIGGLTDILELHVREVGAHHHLEHLEQLAVGNEAIIVDVIHLKSDCLPRPTE